MIVTDLTINPCRSTYTEDKLLLARDMYFSQISPTDIARELEIPLNDVGLLIFGSDKTGRDPNSWYQQRLGREPNEMTSYVKSKRYVLSAIEAKMVEKISSSVTEIVKDDTPLTLDEVKTSVDIVERIDKMNRLERGEATERLEVRHGVTLRDIKNGNANKKQMPIEAEYTIKENEDGKEQQEEQ